MIMKTLAPQGWVVTELEDERPGSSGLVADGKPGLTASEVELSKKLLNTQNEVLSLRDRVDNVETMVEAALISRGSTKKA